MDLTVKNVHELVMNCLYESANGLPPDAIVIEGIMTKFVFDPVRIEKQKENIKSLLLQLPDSFMASGGGGWSFLNACMTKDNVQWGEHADMEALFSLGKAIGMVVEPMKREMWNLLPGGMPYYIIKDK